MAIFNSRCFETNINAAKICGICDSFVCPQLYLHIKLGNYYILMCVCSLFLLPQLMSWIAQSGMRTGIRAEGLSPLVRNSGRSATR